VLSFSYFPWNDFNVIFNLFCVAVMNCSSSSCFMTSCQCLVFEIAHCGLIEAFSCSVIWWAYCAFVDYLCLFLSVFSFAGFEGPLLLELKIGIAVGSPMGFL
jgi:hypothetical protein